MAVITEPKTQPPPAGSPQPPKNAGLALTIIAIAQLMIILDVTVVNVALPSIQRDLNISSINLEWLVNGYSLAFGGLLLLGGRAGDLFGRRRLFILGIIVFTIASLLGGTAMNQTWLIIARVVQGLGGAIIAPTVLSLLTDTFPEGPSRNRAFGVYAAVAGAGGALGLLVGGALTSLESWRWVFFINVPIGILVLVAIPRLFGKNVKRAGNLDLPGGITVTGGMMGLVYGLSHAGTYGFGDSVTIASLVAAVVLLVAFVVIEMRTFNPLMPLKIFSNKTRSGTYAIALTIGAALFSVFFFLTLFIQNILGYSPLRAGLAFLPLTAGISLTAGLVSRSMSKIGPRLPMALGALVAAGGLYWASRLTPGSQYVSGVLGPILVLSVGLGALFVPMTLMAVSGVRPNESGLASALLNTGQQVGGSLGLAVLVNVAASVTSAQIGTGAGQVVAVSLGYSRAFEVAAGICLLAFIIAIFTIRARSPDANNPNIPNN
jgi:EmrB/QacA subfamily drug resistance transporter